MVMVSASGWRVENVVRTFPDRLPVALLRVSWRGYWQADCLTTAEVAEYVDPSTLVPADPHLYARAYAKAPWLSARDLLDAEMETASANAAVAAERKAEQQAAAGTGEAPCAT